MSANVSNDGSIEAIYSDGFILNETDLHDVSPYDARFNVLRAIIDKAPEAVHGKMIRFSVFFHDNRYDLEFKNLPDSARPVRLKYLEQDTIGTQTVEIRLVRVDFGYTYVDENGVTIQEVEYLS